MTNRDAVEEALADYLSKLETLLSLADNQFGEDNCPLSEQDRAHYSLSAMLFGSGCWRWTCGFCGKEDSE